MERTIYNPLYKDTITFISTSQETNGAFTEILLTVMPGGGNPIHVHQTYTETFTPISGVLGLTRGDEKLFVAAGQSVIIEKGVKHNFFNATNEPCKVSIVFRPGHEGIENVLRIGYGLARDGKTNKKGVPHSLLEAAVLFDMSETNMPGFFAFINPLMRVLARRADRLGVVKRLLTTYCS